MVRKRDGDGHPLLLAAREFGQPVVQPPFQADQGEKFRRTPAAPAHLTSHGHGQHDVFDGVEVGNQVARALLPDKAHPFPAIPVQLLVAQPEQILAIDPHAPRRGPIQPAQDVHERGLPAPAGPDDGHQLAFFHRQVQLAQRHLLQARDLVDFDQPIAKNKGFRHEMLLALTGDR